MGGCTMLTQGEKRKLSSQQPNFRVGLLFLELSSSMARLAGRPKGPPRLCTHSSPSGTSLSSHTTGIETTHKPTRVGISSTSPLTPTAL